MASLKPLCFVLMPFGRKRDPSHPRSPAIDFGAIYEKAIRPAIEDAGLSPIRADEEEVGGVIHKPMFERLLLCDVAVADLTIPNANVFYELGVRHAIRHNTTLPIFAERTTLPFDVALLRALPYRLGKGNAFGPTEARVLRKRLGERLTALRRLARQADAAASPVFQLVGKSQQASLPDDVRLRRVRDTDSSLYELLQRYSRHDKTDIFRDVVLYSEARKQELAAARELPRDEAIAELDRIRDELNLDDVEAGVIVDLYLSYRAVNAWDRMLGLYEDMPEVLKRSVLIREQRAFALNRQAGRALKRPALRREAIAVLDGVFAQIGPSSETLGILGRVHKDLWREALEAGDARAARGHLQEAADTYARGFEADWRDAYPGINALTLLDIEGSGPSLEREQRMLPVVRFAVQRRMAGDAPDYWDLATLLELDVLGGRPDEARGWLDRALAKVREKWEPETTAGNLRDIRTARLARGKDEPWLSDIIGALEQRAR
jgi:tetratricopeptide (TPR) repeat protein